MNNSILYDIKELGFIPPRYGGVSVSIGRLINKLTEDGYIVGGFYTSENKDDAILQSELFDSELDLSIKRMVFKLSSYLKLLRPYRVLHSHYSLEHMLYIWCFLHIINKKVVITVHNSMASSFYKNANFINRFFMKRVANDPNVTWIAVSEQAKEEMLKLPFHFKQPIHVIPAYIPDIRIDEKSLSSGLCDYIDHHTKNIVFYGHSFMLHEGKDIYGFKDALLLYEKVLSQTKESVGFILCIAEDRDKDKINELHDIAKSLHIHEKVYWQIGPLKKMNALWNKTDVYIRPTCTDGDSLAVREALDMGVKVVASDVSYRPEGVVKYIYGNMDDLVSKTMTTLNSGKGDINPDYSNYEAIRQIYRELLNK